MSNIVRRVIRNTAIVTQWVVCAFVALLAMGVNAMAFKMHYAKLEATTLFVADIAIVAVAISLAPPVFFRLPIKARMASYMLAPLIFVAAVWNHSILHEAYERTPQGIIEAKAEAAADASRAEHERQVAEQARQEAKRQKDLNEVNENLRYIAEAQQKVQGCINFRGQVPALVRHVKDSLHNPRSFEHVHTEMGTNPQGVPGVVMQYRAENGFGALRTEAVSALVEPDDCSVLAVQEYKAGDFGVE